MRTKPVRSVGTFSCWSQISDWLQGLHTYLMLLKFGFGRCTSDISIAIREGWKSRSEGLELIEAYDGEFDNEHLNNFLEYFEMDKREFDETLAKYAGGELLERAGAFGSDTGHIWYLQAWVAKLRRRDTKNELTSPERFDVR